MIQPFLTIPARLTESPVLGASWATTPVPRTPRPCSGRRTAEMATGGASVEKQWVLLGLLLLQKGKDGRFVVFSVFKAEKDFLKKRWKPSK